MAYDLNDPEYMAAVAEVRAFREKAERQAYALLKIMVDNKDNLHIYGYKTLADALEGTIKITERDTKKNMEVFLKKYPD